MILIRKLERILPWSLLGFVIGVPALFFTFYEKTPDIKFYKVFESNVLDIHREIKNLDILFDGSNIKESGKNLRFYIITIRNEGDKNVLQHDYDQNQIWGLEFLNSKIIERPTIIDGNSDYLMENISPTVVSGNIIELSKTIFEKNKYVSMEIKVIHEIDKQPEIKLRGKIAGIDENEILSISPGSNDQSFLEQVFIGSLIIQIARFGIYFIGIIIALFIFMYIVDGIDRIHSKINKNKIKKYLQPVLRNADPEQHKKIIDFCVSMRGDLSKMDELLKTLESEDKVKMIEKELKERSENYNSKSKEISSFDIYNSNAINKVIIIDGNFEIKVLKHDLELLRDTADIFRKNPPSNINFWKARY